MASVIRIGEVTFPALIVPPLCDIYWLTVKSLKTFLSAHRISYHFTKILRTFTLETCTWGYGTTGTVPYAACQDLSSTWWRGCLMTTTGHSGTLIQSHTVDETYSRLIVIYIAQPFIYKCFSSFRQASKYTNYTVQPRFNWLDQAPPLWAVCQSWIFGYSWDATVLHSRIRECIMNRNMSRAMGGGIWHYNRGRRGLHVLKRFNVTRRNRNGAVSLSFVVKCGERIKRHATCFFSGVQVYMSSEKK